jgi:hypothetical protein
MMRHCWASIAVVLVCWASPAFAADDYRVEPLEAAPEADGLAPAIAKRLSSSGFKVVSGKSRLLCEVWTVSDWKVDADFRPTGSVNYPFEFGELLGVVRFARTATDFRGQKIRKGLYTMRYGLQPQDGNHVGTSDTRDFVVLVPAADDADAAPLAKEKLFDESTNASGTAHPAILSVLPASGEGKAPRMVHHEDRDLWAVDFAGKTADGGKDLLVELVLVGQAAH